MNTLYIYLISLTLGFIFSYRIGRFVERNNPLLPEDKKRNLFAKLLGEPRCISDAYISTNEAVWYQQGVFEGLIEVIAIEKSKHYCLTEGGRLWCAYPVKSKEKS